MGVQRELRQGAFTIRTTDQENVWRLVKRQVENYTYPNDDTLKAFYEATCQVGTKARLRAPDNFVLHRAGNFIDLRIAYCAPKSGVRDFLERVIEESESMAEMAA